MPIFWLLLLVAFLYSPYVDRFFSRYRKSISIFTWSDVIDSETIRSFEKETGIKVYINYYEGNDELLTKLQFSSGIGYDIIVPSHYVVQSLKNRGFIKKIDKSRLDFWSQIDPHLLNHYFDPNNEYSIPYVWDIYGLGINTTFFKDKKIENSWRMLFEPSYNYLVGMTDEPREIIDVASIYLFGNMNELTAGQPTKIKNLLLNQKSFVEAYSDQAVEYLLTSRAAQVVFMPSSSFYRAHKLMEDSRFLIPGEGTVASIENLVIVDKSKKDDLVYMFINHLYKSGCIKQTYKKYGYLPVITSFLQSIDFSYIGGIDHFFGPYFDKIHLIKRLLPRKRMSALWLALKAY